MCPGGKLYILEFSKPTIFPFKQLYFFYFKYILPLIGKIIAKDKSAYYYLPESVKVFPYGNQLIKIIKKCGYINVNSKPLTMGITTIYIAKK